MGIAEKDLPNYTYEDYKNWEGEWELIEGIPYSMTPSPFGIHQKIIMEIGRQISNQLENCSEKCYVYPELDWVINENTVVRPDISVICKNIKEHLKEPPEIVVEVISKSTAQKDESLKFKIYEKEKVSYYILIYPDIKKIRIFKLKNYRYDKYFDGDDGTVSIELKNRCSFEINVNKILED